MTTSEQTLLGELRERLAHGVSADPVGGLQVGLGGDRVPWLVLPGVDLVAQGVRHLLVQGARVCGVGRRHDPSLSYLYEQGYLGG